MEVQWLILKLWRVFLHPILLKCPSEIPKKPYAQHRQEEERRIIDFSSRGEESYNAPFSFKELESALTECADSAAGPDEIPYTFIKRTSVVTQSFILSIINRIFSDHCFPSVWEFAIVLAFAKPGKDSSLPGSYRPIALTCCLCKLMEKMVNVRLVWYLERNHYLSPAQSGFRREHSTLDALVRMESSICEAFASKKHHVMVFFDLKKAYDTT